MALAIFGPRLHIASMAKNRNSREEQQAVKALFQKLRRSPLHTFPSFGGKLDAPLAQGVYVIYSPRGKVLHVGRTPQGRNGIHQRLRDHLRGQSSFTSQYLNKDGSKLRDGYKFRCLVVKSPRRRALLEAYAMGCLCPDHIGLG